MKLLAMLFLSGIFSISAIAQTESHSAKNILSVSPIQVSENTLTGVGVQYEHFIGASGKLSLYFPLAYSFGNSDPCDPSVKTRMLYAYPGIKFYPWGSARKIAYAVGSSLAFGQGATNCNCTMDNMTTIDLYQPKTFKDATEMGLLVNNSINIQAAKHLYIGSDLGIGMMYLNKIGGKNMGTDLMLQFNVKFGYRF